jgi:nucleoside-triphosphatase
LQKPIILLTGNPGVGKTTVLLRVVEGLKARGCKVGGMVSCEARSFGTRVGFEVLDLSNERRGWLAHVNQKLGPQVGRYKVNLADLDSVGAEAIVNAVENSDIVVIDEIGPMELFSESFRKAVRKAVESRKPVLAVVHWKARDALIDEVKRREGAETHVVTSENRENLHRVVVKKVVEFLAKK